MAKSIFVAEITFNESSHLHNVVFFHQILVNIFNIADSIIADREIVHILHKPVFLMPFEIIPKHNVYGLI